MTTEKPQLKGTCYYKGRWLARITIDNQHRHLGVFSSEREAHRAYLKARKKNPPKTPRDKPSPTQGRKPKTKPGSRVIPLTRGYWAIVDAADYERVSQYSWHAAIRAVKGTVYAINSQNEYLHRVITQAPKGTKVLHKNWDTLDNTRYNLLVTDTSGIQRHRRRNQNRPYKGITLHRGKWRAHINHNSKNIHIGYFKTELLAAKAYDAKAKELFGDLAGLNNV